MHVPRTYKWKHYEVWYRPEFNTSTWSHCITSHHFISHHLTFNFTSSHITHHITIHNSNNVMAHHGNTTSHSQSIATRTAQTEPLKAGAAGKKLSLVIALFANSFLVLYTCFAWSFRIGSPEDYVQITMSFWRSTTPQEVAEFFFMLPDFFLWLLQVFFVFWPKKQNRREDVKNSKQVSCQIHGYIRVKFFMFLILSNFFVLK